jgi:membrane protein DedA with SNARE-associated domain
VFRWEEIVSYLVVFAGLLAAGFGLPIPEEAPIVTAGILVGRNASAPPVPPEATAILAVDLQAGFPAGIPWAGLVKAHEYDAPLDVRWWIMLPLCILGVVISDGCLYGIGRIWGERVLDFPWMQRLLPRHRLLEIEKNFQERGVLILLFARMLPGIRAPIFITAGIMKLSLQKFLLADGIYAIPGVSLLFFLSYWFTEQFKKVMDRVDSVRPIIIVAVIAGVGGYLVYHFLNRPVSTGDPKELPIIGEQVAALSDQVAALSKSAVHDAATLREQLSQKDGTVRPATEADPATHPEVKP